MFKFSGLEPAAVRSRGIFVWAGLFFSVLLGGCLKQRPLLTKKVDYGLLRYTNNGLQDTINSFPDFSYAGYEQNNWAIPLVPVKEVVAPGEGDDGDRIQQAVDKVSQLPLKGGFRGAVLLKAGQYEVEGTIAIKASGVVLRGEGQGENGTVITSTTRKPWEEQVSLIELAGGGNKIQETNLARTDIAADIPVGTSAIPTVDATGFHKGDTVVIRKRVNEDWIQFLGMAQYGWKPDQYQIAHRRIITAISGDTLFVNIPMVDAIYLRYGGGYVTTASLPGRITHCAVENMRLKSVYSGDEDEKHAYAGITLVRTVNSWVRNVTALYFGFGAVNITHRSDFNTIQDCAMLDPKARPMGSRMYSFNIGSYGGMGNLFQRCFSRNARHSFSLGARVTGPNAFVDCYGENAIDPSGPHHRWSTGSLFENIKDGILNAHNAKARGTGHGWEGAQTLFWNCEASYMNVSSPPGAVNWAIGCKSMGAEGNGYWFSPGIPVKPRSLFLSQLEDRLGADAVNQISIPLQQQNTNIWAALGRWAGSEQALKKFPN